MPETLLQTKLYAPPLRPNVVSRPRLIERLNQGLEEGKKLTLISAPAGFGKTTLVAEWHYRIPESSVSTSICPNPRFAWLSLDEGDNDPVRFLSYLLIALQRLIPGVGETARVALSSPQPPPMAMVLTPVVNEIATMAEKGTLNDCCYMLVLDDYHVIQAQAVHDALQFILDHLPSILHLAVCGRADLPWSLSRMRANDEITELRSADLRFTLEETIEFLNAVMGLDLSAADLAALEGRTEGWIAGLQLVALSLRDLDNQDRHSFVAAFTGSSRYIVDYLVDEVIARRPEGTQDFLLQTSVLDRMCGPLCDAILGIEDRESTGHVTDDRFSMAGSQSQEVLEQLEQANLFIVPLDDRREWYRYHHLFRDLLHNRLNRVYPDRVRSLHRRASSWYESTAHWDEAIQHAVAAEDYETAARLVEQNAMPIFVRSELARLIRWIDILPDDLVRVRPWLNVYHAWASRLSGAPHAHVASRLQIAEQALEESQGPSSSERQAQTTISEAEAQHIRGHLAAIGAYQALYSEKLEPVQELGYRALALLPPDSFMRSSVALAIGWATRFNGDLAAASKAFIEARDVSLRFENHYVAVTATCRLAYTQMLAGQLRQAAETCEEALQLAVEKGGQHLPVAGYALVYLGAIHYEWNQLDTASQYLVEGVDLCSQVGFLMDQIVGLNYLARVKIAQSDWAEAQRNCSAAKQLSDRMKGYVYARRWAEDCQVRLWLARRDDQPNILSKMVHWQQESGLDAGDEPSFLHELAQIILARVLIALGRAEPDGRHLTDAHDLLSRLLETAESAGWMGKAIEILVLQALTSKTQGDTSAALGSLRRAISFAEAEGYVRVFLDEGQPMARLLYQAAERQDFPEYTNWLLAQFPTEDQHIGHSSEASYTQARSSSLIEPLTRRELEVMQLIAAGATNAQIGQELYIAVGTVKNHVKNIYSKLDVHSRTQAIARSRELGLIE